MKTYLLFILSIAGYGAEHSYDLATCGHSRTDVGKREIIGGQ